MNAWTKNIVVYLKTIIVVLFKNCFEMHFGVQIVKNIPLIVSLWQVFTCILTYTIAVRNGHVYYWFPYISDTGALTPESNVFSQFLNIGAAIMAVGLYIRYRQVDYDIRTKNITLDPIWNKIGIILGLLSSLGVSIVGNFSELSVISLHMLGALMSFGIGVVYVCVQTWISSYYVNARHRKVSKWMFCIRLILTSVMPFLFVCIFLFAHLSVENYRGNEYFLGQFHDKSTGRWVWWTEKDGGHGYRLISAFSEWLLYVLVFVYISTFNGEFHNIELGAITFKLKQRKN